MYVNGDNLEAIFSSAIHERRPAVVYLAAHPGQRVYFAAAHGRRDTRE